MYPEAVQSGARGQSLATRPVTPREGIFSGSLVPSLSSLPLIGNSEPSSRQPGPRSARQPIRQAFQQPIGQPVRWSDGQPSSRQPAQPPRNTEPAQPVRPSPSSRQPREYGAPPKAVVPQGTYGNAGSLYPSTAQIRSFDQSDVDPVLRTPAGAQAAALIVEAHQLASQGSTEQDFTQAVEKCRTAIAVAPPGMLTDYATELASWALNRRGQAKADQGRHEAALRDFDDALRLNPEQWKATHNRGVLLAQAGEFARAFDDINETIRLNPIFAKAYSNRAALFVEAGDLDSAARDYQEAVRLDPNLAVAHKGRGRVCHLLGDLEEALEHFDAAAKLRPTDADMLATRADLLSDLGRYANALEGYEHALALQPQSLRARRGIAWLLATCPEQSIRNAERALQEAEEAMELEETPAHITLDTLAAAQANAGDFSLALDTIAEAVQAAPDAERVVYEERREMYRQARAFRTNPIEPIQQAGFEEVLQAK